jgi:hypothetical protein
MSLDHVARLARHKEILCAHFGKSINLASEKWRVYISQCEEAIACIDLAYEKLVFS